MAFQKEFVEVPERPDVRAFLYADRPGTIYINLSADKNGITKIIPHRYIQQKDA